jgi:hypothetical protein
VTDASDRGWGKGWPTDRRDEMVALVVDGVEFPGGVHSGIHDLMEVLLGESISRGYITLHDGWCWGYAGRFIKTPSGGQTTTPSNHSWGLAIDINAPVNCFGCTSHTIPEAMGALWTSYGFRWGGDYVATKDWMHFEWMGTPASAARATLRAREEFMQDDRLDDYDKGFDAYRDKFKAAGGVDPGDPPNDRSAWFKKGWGAARFAGLNPHGE